MSLLKYFDERGGAASPHHGDLSWPGTAAGFPLRGPVPDLKGPEYEDKLTHVLDYRARGFKLWEEPDYREFCSIQDRAANGWYAIRKREDHWYPEHMAYFVWMEWLQVYGEHVNGRRPTGDPAHGQSATFSIPTIQSPERPDAFAEGFLL